MEHRVDHVGDENNSYLQRLKVSRETQEIINIRFCDEKG